MAEELDQIVDNLKKPSAWLRVLFMLGFAILLYLVIAPVFIVLMVVQALFVLITGDSNENLRLLGAAIGQYVLQILLFISYNSETKPFPFSDFPASEPEDEMASSTAGSTPTKRKTAAKKSPAASKPARKSSNGGTAAADTKATDD